MKCQDSTFYDASKDKQNALIDQEFYPIDNKYNNNMATNDCFLWYKQSDLMLESNTQSADNTPSANHNNQSILCDCTRQNPFNPETIFEKIYIKRSNTFDEVNLIYLQNFVNQIRLNKNYSPFSPYFSTSNFCRTGECRHENESMEFQGDTNSNIWKILPKLAVSHFFINLGWDITYQSGFYTLIRDFKQNYSHIKVFLVSHPAQRPWLMASE